MSKRYMLLDVPDEFKSLLTGLCTKHFGYHQFDKNDIDHQLFYDIPDTGMFTNLLNWIQRVVFETYGTMVDDSDIIYRMLRYDFDHTDTKKARTVEIFTYKRNSFYI